MLVRPGTCTQCHATFQLPSEFTAPFVRCRICLGAVRVDEPVEVEPPPAAVSAAPTPTPEGDGEPAEEHGHDVSVEQAVSRTLYEAADRAHDAAEALEDAGEEMVEASAHAATEAFGMDGGHDHSALSQHLAEVERDVDDLEARIHADDLADEDETDLDEMELELEPLDLDDDDPPAPEHESAGRELLDATAHATSEAFGMDGAHDETSGALEHGIEQAEHDVEELEKHLRDDDARADSKPSPMPTRNAAAWSPAAMERADDEDPRDASDPKGGSTLARLKAERAAAAASSAPSMLDQLKARRGAEAASESLAAEKPMSTLERLKAGRAAEAARTHRPDTVEAKSVSTLERLKAERAGASAAPAAASTDRDTGGRGSSGSRRSSGRGGSGHGASGRRGKRGDQDSERSGAPHHFRSREEQKKRQLVMNLSGLGALVIGVGVSAYGLQQGWFEADEAETAPAATEQQSAGAGAPAVEFIDIFAGMDTAGALEAAGAATAAGAAIDGATPTGTTPDGPLSDLEQESADTGKSMEELHRERLEREAAGEEPDDQ